MVAEDNEDEPLEVDLNIGSQGMCVQMSEWS